MSKLHNIKARYSGRYNPSSNQAHHDVATLLAILTRYQQLVEAAMRARDREDSRPCTRA